MSSMSNKDVRAQASDVVKTHLSRIIMLTLAAAGVPLLLIYVATFIGLGPIMGVQDFSRMSASVAAEVFSSIGSTIALMILCVAASAMLMVGYTRGIQLLAAGVKVKGGVLIGRSKHILGCLGLPAWIGVKTMVWYIPGSLIQSLGTLLMATGEVGGRFVRIAGSILTLILVIPATFRYAMAMQIFAENPDVGVYDAVERSKAMMAHRKWQFFCLTVPYALAAIGIALGIVLASYLLQQVSLGVFGTWLMTLLILAAIVGLGYLMLLVTVATGCYYNAHKE